MTYFMAGVKGVGMSSLASILYDLGNNVIGYDDYLGHAKTEDELIKRNIEISNDISKLSSDMVLIYTSAINDNHPVIKKAKELGIRKYEYHEFVGEFTKGYELISIAGTHGKTTTTALLSLVLNDTLGCSYIVGDGTGHISDRSNIMVLESCEFRKHFLNYFPKYTVITNIDLDHVDCFKDIDEIIETFDIFARQTSDLVLACGDDLNVRKLKTPGIIYYGFNDNNDIQAKNVELTKDGSSFDAYIKGNLFGHFDLNIYGKHMVWNALAVIYISYLYGIDSKTINKSLNKFKGAKRRFSEDVVGNVVLVDDYAHHPKEVETVIAHARQKYKDKTIVSVLIPYTLSRVQTFYKEFAEVLKASDKVFVTDIEPARERVEDYPGITSDLILNLLPEAEHISKEDINKLYKYDNAVILFMGCKDPKWLMDAYKEGLK